MFPYWFDCRNDGKHSVLALSDHSLSHYANFVLYLNRVMCLLLICQVFSENEMMIYMCFPIGLIAVMMASSNVLALSDHSLGY